MKIKRNYIPLSVLLPLQLIAGPVLLPAQEQTGTERQVQIADSLKEREQDYAAAVKIYRNLLQTDGKNTDWLTSAGICYFKLANYEKAKEMFSQAILYTSPQDKILMANAYSNLSASYAHLGLSTKQVNAAMKAMETDNTKFTVWNAAAALLDAKRYQEGIKVISKSRFADDKDYKYLYGRLYYSIGDYGESSSNLKKYIAAYSNEQPEYGDIINAKEYLLRACLKVLKIKKKEDWTEQERIAFANIFTELLNDGNELALYILNVPEESKILGEDTTLQNLVLKNSGPNTAAVLLASGRYREAKRIVEIELKNKDLNTSDIGTMKRLLFLSEYYPFINDLNQDSTAEINLKQLNNLAILFEEALANKKHVILKKAFEDEELQIFLTSILSDSLYKDINQDKIKLILRTIFDKYPKDSIRAELLKLFE